MEGDFRLSLSATSGPKEGQATEGRLRLVPFPETGIELPAWALAPGVRIVLYGGTTIVPEEVGAVVTGSTRPVRPEAAGALVIEERADTAPAATKLTIRLGSRANRFAMPAFEGPSTALNVSTTGEQGFAGTWRSGTLGMSAAGVFCALRTSPSGSSLGRTGP